MVHPAPIGVRPIDLNDHGMDLDEEDEGSLDDSVGEVGSLMDDSDSVQALGSEDVDEWNIPADDTLNSEETMNDSSPQLQD